MGVLMITCPHTAREFATGIQMDKHTFDRLPDVLAHSRCPHCGLQHNWWKREARFVDSIAPDRWVEAQRIPTTMLAAGEQRPWRAT
jgi:hypothetical protein